MYPYLLHGAGSLWRLTGSVFAGLAWPGTAWLDIVGLEDGWGDLSAFTLTRAPDVFFYHTKPN